MDWSKIKTIFILTFLVLDVYLLYELLNIHNSSKYGLFTVTSIENRLKTDEIEYGQLPKAPVKDMYLKAIPKDFKLDEIKKLENTKLRGQTVTINKTSINSHLDKAIPLTKEFKPAELSNFLKESVLYGEEYRFWEWNKEENEIIYYQKFEDKTLYKNISGEIVFKINDNHEIISYTQTYLEGIQELSKEKVIEPIRALENLYDKGMLKTGSKITKVELGYYTHVHTSSSQVLTPAWRFLVNDGESLFVNAFEGQIVQLDNED